jgi:hypothetical protein
MIPAMWEAEAEEACSQKLAMAKSTGDMVQAVGSLPTKNKALNSNLNLTKEKH